MNLLNIFLFPNFQYFLTDLFQEKTLPFPLWGKGQQRIQCFDGKKDVSQS